MLAVSEAVNRNIACDPALPGATPHGQRKVNWRTTQGGYKVGASVPRRSPKKPEPPFATTEEMVAITNVERQTLRQWVKRGLLPPAKIVSDGNGVKSRWPRIALEQARFIKEMRAQLYSLDEIQPMVRERWGTEPAGEDRPVGGEDD
jgi:hypothetical protein